MNVIPTKIDSVTIIGLRVFGNSRGYFFESFSHKLFCGKVFNTEFVQDNKSKSTYGFLRGLHFQLPLFAQSKLVRVVFGKVLDVAVEIRHITANCNYNYIFTNVNKMDTEILSRARQKMLDDNIDIIVNCAAYTNVDRAESDEITENLILKSIITRCTRANNESES